jgi:hypothetical protein
MPVASRIWRVSHVRVQHARRVELEGACLTCTILSSYKTLGSAQQRRFGGHMCSDEASG